MRAIVHRGSPNGNMKLTSRYCLWPEKTVLASMIVAGFRRNAGWEQGVEHAQRAVAQCDLIAADGSANFRY